MKLKPIVDAPRDGTWVLCTAPDWHQPVVLRWLQNERIDTYREPYESNFAFRWDDSSGDSTQDYQPTHWIVSEHEIEAIGG